MDRRDIGTVVFRRTPVKIFLTASVTEVRARPRVCLELEQRGTPGNPYDESCVSSMKRDYNDSHRAAAPPGGGGHNGRRYPRSI